MSASLMAQMNGFGNIANSSPEDDPYYQFTKPILNNLLKAMGKTDFNKPALNIISDDYEVAFINDKGIHVSTKFVDLCQSMGNDADDAMAFVLAHEIGHQEKDHFFALEFGSAYASEEWGQKIHNSFDTLKHIGIYETEADEFGLYFSYSAGYNTINVAEKVIDKIYKDFHLPDEMSGYPPKEFRKEQVKIAEKKVEQLIPVFEIGNFLNILASTYKANEQNALVDAARNCYQHLINEQITTIELYNNLGLSYLNEAVTHKEVEYAIPGELDFYSRLYVKGSSGTGSGLFDPTDEINFGDDEDDGFGSVEEPSPVEPPDPFEIAIEQAIRYFEKCIQLDRKYINAYVNLASANLIWEEYDEAFAKARKAKRLAEESENTIAYRNAIDILALVHYFYDEPFEAMDYLAEAEMLESPLYEINSEFISGLTADIDTTIIANHTIPEYQEMESIDGKSLYDIAYDLFYDSLEFDSWYLGVNQAEIATVPIKDGNLFIYSKLTKNGRANFYTFYYVGNESTQKTRLDIKRGDSSEMVFEKYNSPIKVISGNRYDYWVYIHQNIIFKIDSEQNVVGWILYEVG